MDMKVRDQIDLLNLKLKALAQSDPKSLEALIRWVRSHAKHTNNPELLDVLEIDNFGVGA